MAITCGFFNSLDGDRKYDARQMGEIFDGLIMDGVFMSIGDALKTTPSSGMTVAVGTGRAWFLHTWTKNDSEYLIEVSAAESVLNRVDTIVLDVDNTEAVRNNTIKLIKGTPASNAKRSTLINTADHKQIPLADILVPAGATTLATTNITNIVGTSECPYVTGPLSIIQNDDILAAWQEEFDTWFEGVKGSLDGDTAGNLYNLIMERVAKDELLETKDEVLFTTEPGNVADALVTKELFLNQLKWRYRLGASVGDTNNPAAIYGRIGQILFVLRSDVFQSTGAYFTFYDKQDIMNMLNRCDPDIQLSVDDFNNEKTFLIPMNGDGSVGGHYYMPEWWGAPYSRFYVYHYPENGGRKRLNYVLLYFIPVQVGDGSLN